jgi:myosin heavy chain 6/7
LCCVDLLEKARCISQMPLERCYHIFYQLMSNGVPTMKSMLFLGDDIYQYHFVSQGKITVPSIDDFEEMKMTHVQTHTTHS